MIETIETLNPSFPLSFLPQPPPADCSETPTISDAETLAATSPETHQTRAGSKLRVQRALLAIARRKRCFAARSTADGWQRALLAACAASRARLLAACVASRALLAAGSLLQFPASFCNFLVINLQIS